LEYYFAYADKTNMVNSVFLVLWETIGAENVKEMIIHIGEEFSTEIQSRNLQKYFKKIFLKHDQFKDQTLPMISL